MADDDKTPAADPAAAPPAAAPAEQPKADPPAESSDEPAERTVDLSVDLDDGGSAVIGRHAGDVRAVNGKTSGYDLTTLAEGATKVAVTGAKGGTATVTVAASYDDE